MKVDPGGYWPWTARSFSGFSGSCISARHSAGWMPRAKRLGSYAGRDASTSTSPLRGSSATTAPLRSPSARSAVLLQIAVDGQDEVVARDVGDLLEDTHAAAERVDLDLLPARLAAQLLVPRLLEVRLADQIAPPDVRIRRPRELVLAHLADVAEEVRRQRTVRIVAPRPDAQRHAGQLELVGLERHHAGPVEVAAHHDALVRRALRRRAEPLGDGILGLVEVRGQRAQHRRPVARVLGNEHDVEGGAVVDQQLAVAVVDHAARRRHADQADAVVLRERPHLGPLHHLQRDQPRDDGDEGDEDDRRGDPDATAELGRDVTRDGAQLVLLRLPGLDATGHRYGSSGADAQHTLLPGEKAEDERRDRRGDERHRAARDAVRGSRPTRPAMAASEVSASTRTAYAQAATNTISTAGTPPSVHSTRAT